MSPGETALNRLAKWRTILTGWQLGTRAASDPEGAAVRDHREVSLLLRAEVNGLATLLINKGVFTSAEWDAQMLIEARNLERELEKKFPGAKATDTGMHIDSVQADAWMSKFPP